MRIALGQFNPTVGDLDGNVCQMIALADQAASEGAGVMIFPELALCGYPPEDLVLKSHFLNDCRVHLNNLCESLPRDLIVVAGTPRRTNGHTFNAATVLQNGRCVADYYKGCLPNYDEFDEKRLFNAGLDGLVLEIGSVRLGVHICEDSWNVESFPIRILEEIGLDALLNISASPYHCRKPDQRVQVLGACAKHLRTPVLYCNQIGGQDELVFDGASFVVDKNGKLVARAPSFEQHILYYDIEEPEQSRFPLTRDRLKVVTLSEPPAPRPKACKAPAAELPLLEQVYSALMLALGDYIRKNGFDSVVLGLSGGIDSALVAALAADAIGPANVHAITMPSRYSSEGTRSDAEELAVNMGLDFKTLPIENLFTNYLDQLMPLWPGRPSDVTEENLQARIRGTLVMALSNKFGWLALATGNKSEMAVGYCTLYGDMNGGFAPLKDVPKTMVFDLCKWRNDQSAKAFIPVSTISRPPSAELRDNQQDSDSLPPYDVLDAIIEHYVELGHGIEQIIAEGHDPQTVRRVLRMIDLAEYKRRQGPPGIKVTQKAFGRDRRVPITNGYRHALYL